MAQIVSALDLGTSKVAITQATLHDNGKIKIIGTGSVPYGGFRNGLWLDDDGVADAVNRARKQTMVKSGRLLRQVVVGVPGEFLHWNVKTVSLPVNGLVREAHLQQLLQDPLLLPTREDLLVLHKMPVVYQSGEQLRNTFPLGEWVDTLSACVAVAESQSDFHEDVEALLDTLGLSLVGYVAAPVANAATLLQEEMLSGDVLLIDVGHLSTDVYAARAGGVVYHENIEMGGADVSGDIASALNIEFYEAEMLKRTQGSGFFNQQVEIGDRTYTLQSVVDARLNTLVHAIINVLDTTAIDYRRMNEIYLLGDGASALRGGRELFSAAFGRTVKMQRSMSPLVSGNACNTAISILSYYAQYAVQQRNTGWLARVIQALGLS